MIKNKSFVLTCSVLRLCKDYSITTSLGKPEWSSTAPSIQHCMVVKYSYGSLQGNVPSIRTATKAASAFIVVVALSFCPDATQLIQRCWHTYTVIRFALTSHALPYMDTLVIWPAIICACAYVCDRIILDNHFQWIHNKAFPFHYNYYRTMQEISPISKLSPTPHKREPGNKAGMAKQPLGNTQICITHPAETTHNMSIYTTAG